VLVAGVGALEEVLAVLLLTAAVRVREAVVALRVQLIPVVVAVQWGALLVVWGVQVVQALLFSATLVLKKAQAVLLHLLGDTSSTRSQAPAYTRHKE
tara:strand:- start:108 stop:398 length:291 start_codon:yes stop_codon:yes gene_type:complete